MPSSIPAMPVTAPTTAVDNTMKSGVVSTPSFVGRNSNYTGAQKPTNCTHP